MSSYEAVKAAIIRRIAISDITLLTKYGPDVVMDMIEDVASMYSDTDLDEIGTSDVSCWVLSIKELLERNDKAQQ